MVQMRVDRRLDAGDRRLGAVRTRALVDVLLKLASELPEVRRHRVYGEVAERAERAAEHPAADALEQREVGVDGVALLDSRQQLHEPARPFAAGRALPAGLV